MKRVQAACICQTLHFTLKDDLERNHTLHKIVDETTQEDGSVIVRIIKQYNQSPVGSYLD